VVEGLDLHRSVGTHLSFVSKRRMVLTHSGDP
jgi:hypothetical protein